MPSIYDNNGELVVIYGDRQNAEAGSFALRVITSRSDTEALDPWVAVPLWYWKKLVRYIIDTTE